MKILLIAPSSGHWKGIGKKRLFNGKMFRFSMLSLLTVAALTPEEHDITMIDEQLEDIPWDEHFDLVGITVMTATAPRSYELCRQCKARAIPVVLGGFHPSFNIREASRFADAVVVGPAYHAWETLVKDVKDGMLKQVYYGKMEGRLPAHLPKHLLQKSRYLSIHTSYATLGCRNNCAFCSITAFYKGARYVRPIEEIVEELQAFKEKFFLFVDDNLTQDRDYVVKLCKALTPLKKTWVTQVSVEIADDDELLSLLRDSGCIGVFIGLESFSEEALSSQQKEIKSPRYYRAAVRKFHQHGIFVEAGMIFGFDNDRPEVFESTLAVLDKIGIDAIQPSILTPLPGTQLHEDLKDRIVDRNWEHYDYKHAVFTPAHMTQDELEGGLQWITKGFYSPIRIFKRLFRWLRTPGGYKHFYFPLFLNVAYYGRVLQFKIKGYNPAKKAKQTASSGEMGSVLQFEK